MNDKNKNDKNNLKNDQNNKKQDKSNKSLIMRETGWESIGMNKIIFTW